MLIPPLARAARALRRLAAFPLSAFLIAALPPLAPARALAADAQLASLADLSLEQLSLVQVTSVSRRS
ncbi:MAG TPA: hypothetical protein VE326_14585, partial [Candidatus Binatia bacterium]|nr:hypothetical protein [Candidatus Binatia bacterium]